MSKRRRKPGRLYWLSTFAVGIWCPDKGQRRVNAEMQAKDERIAQLEADNEILMTQNAGLVAERNYYQAQAAMAEGLLQAREVKTAAAKRDVTATSARVYTSWGTSDYPVTKSSDLKGDQSTKVS